MKSMFLHTLDLHFSSINNSSSINIKKWILLDAQLSIDSVVYKVTTEGCLIEFLSCYSKRNSKEQLILMVES